MVIRYLTDNIVFADVVAKWIYDEFFVGIRPGFSYEDILLNTRECYNDKFPIRLVAMEGDICVGTVSFVGNDLKCRDYTPWLSSLYVDEAYRCHKIGEQLVDRVKELAKGFGYNELFLRTEFASDYYRKRGWQYIESCVDEFNLEPDVFKFLL